VFRGLHPLNLDDKGRMAMPVRYRDVVKDQSENRLVLTIDIDEPCLLLYLLEDWEGIEKKLSALPSFNKAARRIQRLLIGHATELELDGNGRFIVPGPLRSYAQLEKKMVMVGQGNKFELWSEQVWQSARDGWLQEKHALVEALPEEFMTLAL
jgi:MraZ protein